MNRRSRKPTVVTVVGARPQFVKAAPLSRALRKRFREVLVHTGQHYDPEMSDRFFEDLGIPDPDHHLGIGSGTHGSMTGRMLEALERVMLAVRPAMVIVLGDTNTTLAGALAAVKLHIPVAHVEAGLRSFDPGMPEEINRRLTDHISHLLFCPTVAAVENLRREGVVSGVYRVGDVMLDAIMQNLARARSRVRLPSEAQPGTYYLATLHRQENVDDPERLRRVLAALAHLPHPVLLPAHPRTAERLRRFGLRADRRIRLRPPASYLEMLLLESGARAVLTDSGGVQKEACILGTPCITLRETTEWVETVEAGMNRLVGTDPARIRRAAAEVESRTKRRKRRLPYGRGDAAVKIAVHIEQFLRADPGQPSVGRRRNAILASRCV